MTEFDVLLWRFKGEPKDLNVTLLITDHALLRYSVIWKQVLVGRVSDYPRDDTWAALWECVNVDYDAIAMLADDEMVLARKTVERLKGLQLIYPDGTLPALAEHAIEKKLKQWMT